MKDNKIISCTKCCLKSQIKLAQEQDSQDVKCQECLKLQNQELNGMQSTITSKTPQGLQQISIDMSILENLDKAQDQHILEHEVQINKLLKIQKGNVSSSFWSNKNILDYVFQFIDSKEVAILQQVSKFFYQFTFQINQLNLESYMDNEEQTKNRLE